jgi:hypothetical protein
MPVIDRIISVREVCDTIATWSHVATYLNKTAFEVLDSFLP